MNKFVDLSFFGYDYGMIIRPFTPDDQQATQQLILDGLAEYWGKIDPSLNTDLNKIEESYQDGYFVVAEEDEIFLLVAR